MDDLSPANKVREAVYDLQGLMFRARRGNNSALPFWNGVKPAELASSLKQLESELRMAAELLRNPQPGQGLDSLYVRAVATRYACFEERKLSLRNGLADVLSQDGIDDLDRLANKAPMFGTELKGRATRGPSDVVRLLEPEKRALDRLREKVAAWAAAFADVPNKPQGADDFVKSCGRLLLEAIDQCELPAEQMMDAAFAEETLSSLGDDGYCLLLALCGRDFGPPEVMQLVDSFTGAAKPGSYPADGAAPENQAGDGAGDVETPAYPNPATYARDQWIYENIECNSFPSLQLKLKKVAKKERFDVISSRPGLKKSADRYADYHSKPKRRFLNPRNKNS